MKSKFLSCATVAFSEQYELLFKMEKTINTANTSFLSTESVQHSLYRVFRKRVIQVVFSTHEERIIIIIIIIIIFTYLRQKQVIYEQSYRWVQSGDIKGETQSTIVAAEDQAVSTNYFKNKFLKEEIDSKCHVCKQHEDILDRLTSGEEWVLNVTR